MTHGNIIRRFWAAFLACEVGPDGQVPGFRAWWDEATDLARREADRFAEACWIKIERDHRDPEGCITAGVHALRAALRSRLGEFREGRVA